LEIAVVEIAFATLGDQISLRKKSPFFGQILPPNHRLIRM
jgi:hypothetical protein